MRRTTRHATPAWAALSGGMVILALLASTGIATAADWPQWRGPHRDGVSQETGLLKQWPKAGPKLLWQVKDLGLGYSTPAVVGDRLYLMSNTGETDEFVKAFSASDGKPAWSVRVGRVGNPNQQPNYPAARSTPTVDGDRLYALGSDGDLVCLETASGTVVWQKNLRKDFGGNPGKWAYAESPLVDGDVLVCTPGGAQATMIALNKKNAEVIWKSAVPGGDPAAYSSVIIVDAKDGGGVKQYVQSLEKGLVGVDAQTGKFLWRYDQEGKVKSSPAVIPTPTAHAGYVYTGAERAGGGTVRLQGGGGAVQAKQVYQSLKLPSAIGGAVLVGDHLYGTTKRGLQCVEFTTGKQKWEDRSIGAASLLYADGRLYLHGENGEVALVEASPDAYKEHGRFAPPDQPEHPRGSSEKAWAYPVVANGRLYIRDEGSLWCFDVKDPAAR